MNEQVAEIVAAYLRNNTVAAGDIPGVITQVYQSLAGLGRPPAEQPHAGVLKPAVPVRRSVTDDVVTCLECGFKAKLLRQHLAKAHSLTPEAYRLRWNLPAKHPIVAPGYSVRRAALAKTLGFGKRGNTGGRRKAN